MQGALLLVLFQVSHFLEHKLTDQAQGNLQALFDAAPEHATLVQLHADGSPDMSQLQKATAKGVATGSHMLVRPGEQVKPYCDTLLLQCTYNVHSLKATHVAQSIGCTHGQHGPPRGMCEV